MSVLQLVRAIAEVITTINLPQLKEKFVWKYLSSNEFLLKLLLLNDIAAENAQLRKRWPRCVLQAYQCAVLRISARRFGGRASASTISELNQKAYVHIEEWRNRPISGSVLTVFISSEIGAVSSKT